jgi:hypothetical protein
MGIAKRVEKDTAESEFELHIQPPIACLQTRDTSAGAIEVHGHLLHLSPLPNCSHSGCERQGGWPSRRVASLTSI